MKLLRMIGVAAMTALLLVASAGYADVVLTGITVTPNPIGVNDTAMITIEGHLKTYVPGSGWWDCPAFEVTFQDPSKLDSNSPYPFPPPTLIVRMQPASSASFPISVIHQFTQIGSFDIRAVSGGLYHGGWLECYVQAVPGGPGAYIPSVSVTLDVLGDTIRSVQSITPAVVNQQTSVSVKGFGSCSKNVQVDWGDGSSSTIAGPVNLKLGGIASHTYTSGGTRTVKASGSVCDGTATTTISVAQFQRPDHVFDPVDVAGLRQRLDRFAHLPPPPPPGGGPGCPVCAGLAQQVILLDQTGRDLQIQSDVIVKDLSIDGGKGVRADKVPIVGDLTKQLDEYLMLREQLLKRYKKALAKPGPGQKQLPPQPGRSPP